MFGSRIIGTLVCAAIDVVTVMVMVLVLMILVVFELCVLIFCSEIIEVINIECIPWVMQCAIILCVTESGIVCRKV